MARDAALLNAVSRVFFEEAREWLRAIAGPAPGARVEAAAVTFVQRFGGSLNLNPHLHVQVADGVFVCREDVSSPEFMATPAPTSDDLCGVVARVIARLETIARRRGAQPHSAVAKAASRELPPTLTGARTSSTGCSVDPSGSVPGRVPRWTTYSPGE